MSVLKNTTVNGVVTQTQPASEPNHLIRLGEAQTLLTSLMQGAYSATANYGSGQLVNSGGDLYLSIQPSGPGNGGAQTPGSAPAYWTLVLEGGEDGTSSFTYVGFANDASGDGFSLTPATGLNYIAILVTTTEITSPTASNFAGLWVQYVGAQGEPGDPGDPGAAGAAAYMYVAYASDASGDGFSLTPGVGLNYVAFLSTNTPISGSPTAANFTGLWSLYASAEISIAGGAPLTLTGGVLGMNASSANTANFVVQRDGSGNFSAGQVSVTSLIVGGSATLSFASSSLQINQPVVMPALTVTGLSGVLMASSGAVSGGATTDNLPQGATNLYFSSAGVLGVKLTGLTSTNELNTNMTIIQAFSKVDQVLGGSYLGGTVTGNLAITGTLSVSGTTTLSTTLSGLLFATSGVVSTSGTTDNLPQGSTNLYMTTAGVQSVVNGMIGINNGVCGLGSTGYVPWGNLPPLTGYASTTGTITSSDTILTAIEKLNGNLAAFSSPLTAVLTGFASTTGTISSSTSILSAFEILTGNLAVCANTNLPSWTSGTGTISSSDTILSALQKLNGNITAAVAAAASTATLSGYASTTGTITGSDTILSAIEKLNGNISGYTAPLTQVLTGWASTTGVIGSGDTILSGLEKLNGNLAVYLSTQPLGAWTAGAGTITTSDTILTALQKLSGNMTANYLALAGGQMTGNLTFNTTTAPGLIANQLSSSQIGSLSTSGTYNGAIVYNTSANTLMALVNGSYVTISAGASLPLSAGSSYTLTGTLYFQDGLSTFLQLGSNWSQRVSNSDLNMDILHGGTTIFTCDSSGNVHAPDGMFDTPNGYNVNGNKFADSNANIFDKLGNQVVTERQTLSLSGGGHNTSGWADSTANSDFGKLISALVTHGLIA